MIILRPSTDCDISHTGMDYALIMGKESQVGEPEKLLMCNEIRDDEFKVEEILDEYFPHIPREYVGWLSPYSWMLVFERGIFVSQGP